MTPQERINKLKDLSSLLSRNLITWHDWQIAVQNENEDFNAGLPDALNQHQISMIYRMYNFQTKRINAHITMYLEMNGGRINPISIGYRPHLIFDNNQQTDCVFIFDSMIYPGDDWTIQIDLLTDINIFSELMFGIYEGNKKVGHGIVI